MTWRDLQSAIGLTEHRKTFLTGKEQFRPITIFRTYQFLGSIETHPQGHPIEQPACVIFEPIP